ncbi:hypothetical protein Poly24_01620 [Rosistilla carotiformis]|uniref:Uncharacterized protein n=1 Tax=Rosistilla carotiformis TaxID=2528017 RepID=A0A518JLP8_9BACT|nr:hypothetical protein [Rosistilla carotiformis]QDV66476.1 hypothetical protein Poly24_01620 [Rosistilla carotiformis]
MKTLTKIKNQAIKFHKNEAGLEALQVVMIIAIAAIFLIFIKTNWETVKGWAQDLIDQITGFTE